MPDEKEEDELKVIPKLFKNYVAAGWCG